MVYTDTLSRNPFVRRFGHDIPLALGSVDKRVTWGELISNAYPSQSGTYSVGFLPHADHKGCMSALADAGTVDSYSYG
jgi:hypothetical protein